MTRIQGTYLRVGEICAVEDVPQASAEDSTPCPYGVVVGPSASGPEGRELNTTSITTQATSTRQSRAGHQNDGVG